LSLGRIKPDNRAEYLAERVVWDIGETVCLNRFGTRSGELAGEIGKG
jgi:hypothetical protein